jgi:peptidoglycan/xylan/chitin deacetylase (PgdA/CDA1 family)
MFIMLKTAYLTIDDSPTSQTDDLTDFLVANDIPAILYCIGGAYEDLGITGQGIEQNPQPLLNAIDKGFALGNHLYTHQRSSDLTADQIIAEIEATEAQIERLYKQSGKARPFKTLRLPHLDRGCGGWVIDYDRAGVHKEWLEHLFLGGLNITLAPPSAVQIDIKARVQDYLKAEGFTNEIFADVIYPWFTDTEMAQAFDALCTFSSADWMLNPAFAAHSQSWPHKNVPDLIGKIDMDAALNDNTSADIILMHDHENLLPITIPLIKHMLENGIKFLPPTGVTP